MEELNSKKPDAGGPREKLAQELAELRHRLDEEQREAARLRLEMDRLKAAQDRAWNRAPYRSLLENMNDVVMRFNRQLRLIYVNPAIEAQTGRHRSSWESFCTNRRCLGVRRGRAPAGDEPDGDRADRLHQEGDPDP